jgi:hypothetical protein
MGYTEKIITLLKTGQRFHSKDLFKETTWDFRKYASNAKKILERQGYKWHTEPADKKMNWYWITKDSLF